MSQDQPVPGRNRRVVIFAPSFPPAFLGGGPARTLSALVRTAPSDFDIFVVTPDRDADGSPLDVISDQWTMVDRTHVLYANTSHLPGVKSLYRTVKELAPDIVYLNSFFNPRYSILPAILCVLRYWGTPRLLVAPRGEFDAGALSIRRFKKSVFILLAKVLRLHTNSTWHASASLEAEAIRKVWGSSVTILIRENETSLPISAIPPPAPPSNDLSAVFLSRIAPKKGLLTALKALRAVEAPIQFDIYGPEEDRDYANECRQAAEQLPANVKVTFRGAVGPGEATAALASHDVLLIPTAGENFGHVIAEALSVSCAVICPDTTPWSGLLRDGGGILVEPNTIMSWQNAIIRLQTMNGDELRALRVSAGNKYNEWRQQPQPPHVFSMM